MSERILITGGAGFIGSHLADELLGRGYHVRVLDNLSEQVHGAQARRPHYLDPDVELIVGDVRDRYVVRRALERVDAVFHLAAMVGVGQSMYQIDEYTSVNNQGTAGLLQEIIKSPHAIRRLIVASSMSLYGEGMYCTPQGVPRAGLTRTLEQLRAGRWELHDELGRRLQPIPTAETAPPCLNSVYALSKYDQEQLCLVTGRAYDVPTVALRFFNTYGPRQALSNPYTGVLAIFASRLLNNKAPLIYEDGNQLRDFVSVYDVARACRLALEAPEAASQVFNVGSGRQYTVEDVARRVARALDKDDIQPQVTGQYRVGDVRHCFPDMTKASYVLGYEPAISLEDGLLELAEWLSHQAAYDYLEEAQTELQARRLTV